MRFIRPDPRSRVTDPVGDIVSFIHMFEEKYGRIHPVFYQGTYSQVGGNVDSDKWNYSNPVLLYLLESHSLSFPLKHNCNFFSLQK